MDKKYKIASVFLIFYLILVFPIFIFTKNKLKSFNMNEKLDLFSINTLVKFDAINQFQYEVDKTFTELNNKLFNSRQILTSSFSEVGLRGLINKSELDNSSKYQQEAKYLNLFEFTLPTENVFKSIGSFVEFYNKNNFKNCSEIREAKIRLIKVNPTSYLLKSSIIQKKKNNSDQLGLIFQECLMNLLNIDKYQFSIETLSIFNFFTKENLVYNTEKYFNVLNISKNDKDYFKAKIFNFENHLNQKIIAENLLEFKFSKIYDYNTKDLYSKNFNITSVSLLLTFLCNSILVLIIYFISIRIKILNKIFN